MNITTIYRHPAELEAEAMLDTERGELTPFGRETLAELHNSFIAELDENGWPEMPLAH